MRSVVLSQTGAGSSVTFMTDTYRNPFNIGIGVVVSGTVNYTIQHTFDDVFNPAVTPTWFSHPTLVALTANADGNYAFPVKGIKVLVNSGAGTATATLVQAGVRGG